MCDECQFVVDRYSLSASAGVLQPSVLRGRLLSAAATAARSSASWRARSVPLGKYWRSSPLVFSLLPRCHGLLRVAEVDRQPGLNAQLGVLGHLGALVPGQRAAQLLRQRDDRRGDRVADRLGAVPGQRRAVVHPRTLAAHRREVQQHREAARALDQRADRRAAQPEDQVAFPVPRDRPVLRPRRDAR